MSHTIEYQALQRIASAHDGDRFAKLNLTQELIDAMSTDITGNKIVTRGQIPSIKIIGRHNPAIQFAFLECTLVVTIVNKSELITPEYISTLTSLRQILVPLAFLGHGPEWRARMEKRGKPELVDMIADFSRNNSANLDKRRMSAHIEELNVIIGELSEQIIRLEGKNAELRETIGNMKQEAWRLKTKLLEATGQLK